MTDLPKKLRIKAGVINMGGRIAWGSETALMEEAADLIEQQQAEIDALKAHVERLLIACQSAHGSYGKILLSDPPKDAWKFNQVTEKLVEAIAATLQQSLAEHDAEVERKAYRDGFMAAYREGFMASV